VLFEKREKRPHPDPPQKEREKQSYEEGEIKRSLKKLREMCHLLVKMFTLVMLTKEASPFLYTARSFVTSG
jgi:hypothetical protein